MKLKDLTGQRIGRLTVIRRCDKPGDKRVKWLCRCDCGNYKEISRNNLSGNHTLSCGCIQKEKASSWCKSMKTHGDSDKRLYTIWVDMKQRVENPNDRNYHNYGERGIEICEEWEKYENFKEWSLSNGYSDNLSIDRKDVDKGYFPDNCRWVDQITQANNKRNNVFVEYKGKRQTVKEWSRELNINYETLISRLKKWSVEESFERPVRYRKKK